MKKIFILFAILLFPVVVNATSGAIYINGNGEDYVFDSYITNDGGMVVVGYSNSTDLFSSATTPNDTYGYIIKYDENGNKVWDDVFDGDGEDYYASVIELNDESIVVVGSSDSNNLDSPLNFNGIKNFAVKYNHSGSKVKTVKLNQQFTKLKKVNNGIAAVSGTLSEYQTIGYTMVSDNDLNTISYHSENGNGLPVPGDQGPVMGQISFNSIDQLSNGYYVFVGEVQKTSTDYVGGIYISNPEFTSVLELDNEVVGSNYVDVVAVGDCFYAVGYSGSDVTGSTNNGGYDILVSKYSSSGDLVWHKLFGSSTNEVPASATLDGDNISIVAYTFGSSDSPDGLTETPFYITVNSDGTKVDEKRFSATTATSIMRGIKVGDYYSIVGTIITNDTINGYIVYKLSGVNDPIDDDDHRDSLDPEENPDNPQPEERNPHTGTFISVGIYGLFILGFTVFAMKRGYNVIRKI